MNEVRQTVKGTIEELRCLFCLRAEDESLSHQDGDFNEKDKKKRALVWFPLDNPDAVSNYVIAKNVEYFMRILSLLESDE